MRKQWIEKFYLGVKLIRQNKSWSKKSKLTRKVVFYLIGKKLKEVDCFVWRKAREGLIYFASYKQFI